MDTIDLILERKGATVVTAAPHTTALDAVRLLAHHGVGAVVVVDEAQQVLGLASERAVLLALAARGAQALSLPLEQVMMRGVPTAAPEDRIEDCLSLMTNRRVRHLPVVREGTLVGIVSIGDLVKARIDTQAFVINQLGNFICDTTP